MVSPRLDISTDRICKCCGQTLPIIGGGIELSMPDGLKQLVEAVRKAGKHGIHTDRLFDALYGNDPDGGPTSGTKTLHVRISQANKRLKPLGYRICGENTGVRHSYGRYFLNRIDQEVSDAAE